ncbi:MAG TPA: VWA domain-containing protein, partial [Pyrinomonadaceae bacterium]|nr:VWA domain-containing protein [Pyrinomonadaceae bacterium]
PPFQRRGRRDTQRAAEATYDFRGHQNSDFLKMSWISRTTGLLLMAVLFSVGATQISSQEPPKPKPLPSPTPEKEQDSVKVFTEEVRLPVVALDAYGHYDPTLELDDVLVLEDGVIQQLRSVRHIPANVLFVLDTGGESSGMGGMSKSTSLTRQVASQLVSKLQEGASIAVMQSGNKAEMLQPWTTDKNAVLKTLRSKIISAKRSRISEAIVDASTQMSERPEGSRHVVMITDGVDSPGGKVDREQALKKLVAARATVHIISYTEFVRQKDERNNSSIVAGPRPPNSDPIRATDPTQPPGQTRSPSYSVRIKFDPAMRKLRKAYEAEVKKSEQALKNVAEETGGKMILPLNSEEMLAQANDVARAIGAEYVVTYRPKRPLAEASPGEYRRIEVASRRVGLSLQSRRGYVVPQKDTKN